MEVEAEVVEDEDEVVVVVEDAEKEGVVDEGTKDKKNGQER